MLLLLLALGLGLGLAGCGHVWAVKLDPSKFVVPGYAGPGAVVGVIHAGSGLFDDPNDMVAGDVVELRKVLGGDALFPLRQAQGFQQQDDGSFSDQLDYIDADFLVIRAPVDPQPKPQPAAAAQAPAPETEKPAAADRKEPTPAPTPAPAPAPAPDGQKPAPAPTNP